MPRRVAQLCEEPAETTERSYQTHSHNLSLKIKRLVRRFLLRISRSCCYIIISIELKVKHTLELDGWEGGTPFCTKFNEASLKCSNQNKSNILVEFYKKQKLMQKNLRRMSYPILHSWSRTGVIGTCGFALQLWTVEATESSTDQHALGPCVRLQPTNLPDLPFSTSVTKSFLTCQPGVPLTPPDPTQGSSASWNLVDRVFVSLQNSCVEILTPEEVESLTGD